MKLSKREKYALTMARLGLVHHQYQDPEICVDKATIRKLLEKNLIEWEEQHNGLWGKYILTESGKAVAERFLNEGELIALKFIRDRIVFKKGDYGIKEVTLSVLLEKEYVELDETSEKYILTDLGKAYLKEVENEAE